METSQTATLHTALTNAQGDRDAAAAHLGITREAINEAIRTTPELKALWTRTTELPLADAVDRNRMSFDLEDITPKQAAIADGFARQETKLQRFDWEGLGVTDPGTVALMNQFERSVGGGIVRMLDAMCGGMGYCFAQVSARFAFAAKKMSELEQLPVMTPVQQAEYAYWHNCFMDYAKEMKGFNKEATNAAHTRLLIADRARKMKGTGGAVVKPGWKKVGPALAADRAAMFEQSKGLSGA